MVEFSIIAGSLLAAGLFVLQMGLLYHAKTTMNYAVFEAARVGAVNNASISSMRTELGRRLAPLEGGDGTAQRAAAAIAKSAIRVVDTINTRIDILNPTREAFRDWAVTDSETGRRVIPVNHLRHQSYSVGAQSGLSVRDATLLKIKVTHGIELSVPFAGTLMTNTMKLFDPQNAEFYIRGKWPLQAVAIVRMQSDAYEDDLQSANAGGKEGTNDSANSSSESEGSDYDQHSLDDVSEAITPESSLITDADQEPDTDTQMPDTEPDDLPTDVASHCEPDIHDIRPFAHRASADKPIASGSLPDTELRHVYPTATLPIGGRLGINSGLISTSTIRDWIQNRG